MRQQARRAKSTGRSATPKGKQGSLILLPARAQSRLLPLSLPISFGKSEVRPTYRRLRRRVAPLHAPTDDTMPCCVLFSTSGGARCLRFCCFTMRLA